MCHPCLPFTQFRQPFHDRCRSHWPWPMGKKHRRGGTGQKQDACVSSAASAKSPNWSVISRRPKGSSYRPSSKKRLPTRACRRSFSQLRIRFMWGRSSAVAAAGKPVWCEKPLALTRTDAERAIEATKKAGVPFALGNNKRCFPCMRELKRIVSDGTLGEILHIEGNFSNEHSTRIKGGWRDDPGESPGGGMTGAGLHVLDAFVNLVGPVAKVDARVFAQKPPPDPRDVAAALMQFENGATGLLATVRAAPMFWRIHVFGTRGFAEAREETALTVAMIGGQPETKTFPPADFLAFCLRLSPKQLKRGSPSLCRQPICSTSSALSRPQFAQLPRANRSRS